MFHPNKYITDTILPQEDLEPRSGKKMFGENVHEFMDNVKNAGVHGQRISELNLNSRKKIAGVKSDSSQMREALNHYDIEPLEVSPKKKPLTYYSGYENQEKYFETKLVPDHQGKMSICVGRKAGSATVNMSLEDYDLEKTYHTWKRIMNRDAPHTRSNLENDRFLTVSVNALRSDKPPEVKNRNPPIANPDGPFEKDPTDQPIYKRGNLDRTLTPKENSQRRDAFRKVQSNYTPTSYIFHGNTDEDYYKGYGNGEEAFVVKGVRRTQFPWIETDRLKNILQNKYDDEVEDGGRSYKENNSGTANSLSNDNKMDQMNHWKHNNNNNTNNTSYESIEHNNATINNYSNHRESQRINEEASYHTNESYDYSLNNTEYEKYNNQIEYENSLNHQNINHYNNGNYQNTLEKKTCCNYEQHQNSYQQEPINPPQKNMSDSYQSFKIPSITNISEY